MASAKTTLSVLLLALGVAALLHAQTADEVALSSFKSLVHRHAESYKPNGREHVTQLAGGWVKENFTIDADSLKFDVEKTSSLVSPYVGTVSFMIIRHVTNFHSEPSDAAADNVFTKRFPYSHKHIFGYQENAWRPTSRTHYQVDHPAFNGDCDVFLGKKKLPSDQDNYGCLEEFDEQSLKGKWGTETDGHP